MPPTAKRLAAFLGIDQAAVATIGKPTTPAIHEHAPEEERRGRCQSSTNNSLCLSCWILDAIQSSHQMNRISAVAAALVCFFAVSSSVPVAALPSPRGRAVLGASNRASTSVATTAEISSCPRLRSHRPTWRRPKCVPGHFWNCYRGLTALAGDLLLLIIVHRRKATHGTITTLVSTFHSNRDQITHTVTGLTAMKKMK